MRYDFTTIYDRHGKDALAVDGIGMIPGTAPELPGNGFDVIPMWVADMNFSTAPSVIKAIKDRCKHPLFGYFSPREEYFDAIIRWQKLHIGLSSEHIGYENGVLGGVASALKTLCCHRKKVLLHSPTYIGFTKLLANNGYKTIHSPLVLDADGIWRMDYEDMERKIVDEGIQAAIFCSPHNPTGRVWSREEILQMMDIFKRHDVFVISDEIWSDIVIGNNVHIPTQTVSEDARQRTIALYAPTKTFNIAGLVGSYHIVYNEDLRSKMQKESSLCHYNDMNVLSMYALIGGYSEQGTEWVGQLRAVLTENMEYASEKFAKLCPEVKVMKPQGTYMMFPDFTQWCKNHGRTIEDIERACWAVGVAVQDGRMFHGPCHLRMNLALPLSRVEEAFNRMGKYVFR